MALSMMIEKLYLFLWLLGPLLVQCTASKSRLKKDKIEDFSLEGKVKEEEMTVAHLDHKVVEKSSLPLPIVVGKGGKDFNRTPKQAWGGRSKVKLIKGRCRFVIRSGPVRVDQFLWTGRWVKYRMSLEAKQVVKLEPKAYGNFRAAMDIFVLIRPKMLKACAKEFKGKRLQLGYFHFNRSKLRLIQGPRSKKINFNSRGGSPSPRAVFLNWPSDEKFPQLQDQYELPSNLTTPIYRAKFKSSGRYYLAVTPILSFKVDEKSLVSLERSHPKKKKVRYAH